MSDDEKPICPNCNEEVEPDWLKCPMCNHHLKTSAGAQATTTPKPKKATPEKDSSIEEDLKRSDEARKISDMAAERARNEERIKDLKAATDEKEKRIAELQKAIEREKQKAEEMQNRLKAIESSGGGAEEALKERERLLEQKEEEINTMEEEALTSVQDIADQRAEIEKALEDLERQRGSLAEEEQKIEEKRTKVKEQANALTVIEMRIEEHNKNLSDKEESLSDMEGELERSKRELDQMIERYGDKLTSIKARERTVDEEIVRIKDLEKKVKDEGEMLKDLQAQLEREKEEVTTRSNKLFERIQSTEERTRELDEREGTIKDKERHFKKWEEDLKHTEIHLMSIQKEIDDCVYCSVKDRFSTVDRIIIEAKNLGAEVDMAEEKVKAAKLFLDEGEFDKAVAKATEAITLAKQAKKQYYSYGVKYTIKKVEKTIKTIKDLGVSTDEPEGLIKEAKESLAIDDWGRAEEFAKMAERISLHMEEKAEDIASGMKRLREGISSAKTEGRSVPSAEEHLLRAEGLAKEGNYGNSLETLKKGEKVLAEELEAAISQVEEEPAPVEGLLGSCPSCGRTREGTSQWCTQCGGSLLEEQEAEEAPPPGPPVEEYDAGEQWTAQETAYDPQPGQAYQPYQAPLPTEQTYQMERFKCPHCMKIFEVRVTSRPVTTTCPYCDQKVMIT